MISFKTGVAFNINTKGVNKMILYKKLENKIKNRIGTKAIVNDDMIVGTIINFNIETIDEGTPEARLTVNYFIEYDDVVRIANENNVTILCD